jgi:hypothetical protein
MRFYATFSRTLKTLLTALVIVAPLSASSCSDGTYGLGPSSGYGRLYVSVRNISPFRAHAEGLYRGGTELYTLNEGDRVEFEWDWYDGQATSNAILTVYIDTPSGRKLLPVQNWQVSQGNRSISCVIVSDQNYYSGYVSLQCSG